MPLRQLALTAFRSYESLTLDLEAGPHVVVGRNGAGKTNLVEAIVVLSRGRSHRSSSDTELIRWGSPFARLVASVQGEGQRQEELEVVLRSPGSGTGARKRVRVNGVGRRTSAAALVLRSVLFAPEDMLLVVGSPTLRRSFLDALTSQREPTAAGVMAAYSRALTQRNSLLRRIREEAASRDELTYWDSTFCESGGQIRRWRGDALEAIRAPLAAAHAEIAPGESVLTLEYVTNALPQPGEDPAAALSRRLAETADKEIWNGATLVGPHRDDLVFRVGGRDLPSHASRGQQRTAILALKLAELDLLTELDGRPPLLLLDDVFSELDPERRAHLVRRIGALPQAIVTTTSTEDLDSGLVTASRIWHVEPGCVRAAA
ncbi:DNA replication/repair protein RecF [soil metagenome]